MGRKTVDDLSPTPSSVGGAMSQWPRRTLNWICRDIRVNAADEYVADRLLNREIKDLRELRQLAIKVNINPDGLHYKEKALDNAHIETILQEIKNQYDSEYSDESMRNCPFEDSGLDKACWRCPVAGNVLDQLEERVKRSEDKDLLMFEND